MTLNPNPVKEYLSKIGIKHNYHSPVLSNQKKFFIIKIDSVEIMDQDFVSIKFQEPKKQKDQIKNDDQKSQNNDKIKWEGKVTFKIGCRSSFTEITLNIPRVKAQGIKNEKNQQQPKLENLNKEIGQKKLTFDNEIHLFPFELEEVMTARLDVVQKIQQEKNKQKKQKQYKKQYGYALVPLVPFIKMPYTHHMIEIGLVSQNEKKKINQKKNIIVKLNISLYFMHNFKARLFVEVVKADLERNLAMIGQMYPMVRMYLRDLEFQTEVLEEGGIKPNWKIKDQFCYFNIPLDSVNDDLYIYLFYNREVTIDEIVGKLTIDLQKEKIFKTGSNMEVFIKDVIQAIENKEKKNKENEKVKPKTFTIDEQNFSEGTILEQRMQNMFSEFNQERQKMYKQKLQSKRKNFIRDLITKPYYLSSSQPPQLTKKLIDEINKFLIQQLEKKNEKILKKTPEFLKNECIKKLNTYINDINFRQDIKKLLMDDIKEVGKIIGSQMQGSQKQVSLKSDNPLPKSQVDKQRTAGLLYFRTLFLYEFEYEIKESQSYVENDLC